MAQSGSAPGLGPGGRKFESCCPDHCWLLSVLSVDPRKQPFLQKSAPYSTLIEWTELDKIDKNKTEVLAIDTTYQRLSRGSLATDLCNF